MQPNKNLSFVYLGIDSPTNGHGENGYAEIDWDSLGFGLTPTDYMYKMKCFENEEFTEGQLIPFGNIELSPAATVLNYGQVFFLFSTTSMLLRYLYLPRKSGVVSCRVQHGTSLEYFISN